MSSESHSSSEEFGLLCRCLSESCQNKIGILGYNVHIVFYSTVSRHFPTPQLKITHANQLLKLLFTLIIKHIMCIVLGCFNRFMFCAVTATLYK